MQRKEIIMQIRNDGKLKGLKPCFVYLKQNMGKIYNEGHSDFVMSLKGDILYFQKLSFFFHNLKPRYDFELNINRFVSYSIIENRLHNCLYLYDKQGNYMEVCYNKGIPDTAPTEININRIIKVLEEKGIKQINLDDSKSEEINNDEASE